MSKYFDIRIDYKTGDSFKSYETSDTLDLPVESLEIAKENLRRIKEHYKVYIKKNSYSMQYSDKREIQYPDFYITKATVSHGTYDVDGIRLKVSETKERDIISPFWIGYFESLIGAEVIVSDAEEDDLSFKVDFW